MDAAFNFGSLPMRSTYSVGISIIALSLAATGVVVGAVHGMALVWLSARQTKIEV